MNLRRQKAEQCSLQSCVTTGKGWGSGRACGTGKAITEPRPSRALQPGCVHLPVRRPYSILKVHPPNLLILSAHCHFLSGSVLPPPSGSLAAVRPAMTLKVGLTQGSARTLLLHSHHQPGEHHTPTGAATGQPRGRRWPRARNSCPAPFRPPLPTPRQRRGTPNTMHVSFISSFFAHKLWQGVPN